MCPRIGQHHNQNQRPNLYLQCQSCGKSGRALLISRHRRKLNIPYNLNGLGSECRCLFATLASVLRRPLSEFQKPKEEARNENAVENTQSLWPLDEYWMS